MLSLFRAAGAFVRLDASAGARPRDGDAAGAGPASGGPGDRRAAGRGRGVARGTRALLAALVAAAALLGGAGAATLAVERRLAALAPGEVTIAALHYNPLSGHLALAGVRARDAGGRERFRAERVEASAPALALLGGPLRLARVRVQAPVLTASAAEVRAGLPGLRVDDLVARDGRLVIERGEAPDRPLRAEDVTLQAGRLTTARRDRADVAFALHARLYGSRVHVTGQPREIGYALHVRAADLDLAALARDLPALAGVQAGRGEVDVGLWLAGERVLAAGHVRAARLVVALPARGRPRLRVRQALVVADGFELRTARGRLSRVVLEAPALALPVRTAAPTLAALLARLRAPDGLHVRRVGVVDGTLALTGPGGVRLQRVQLSALASERQDSDGWAVSARAALDSGADVALEGRLARDLGALDAAARVRRAAAGPWRALTAAALDWDPRVSFEGRLLVAREGALTLSGQAGPAANDATGADPAGVTVYRSVETRDPGAGVRQLLGALEDAVHAASAR